MRMSPAFPKGLRSLKDFWVALDTYITEYSVAKTVATAGFEGLVFVVLARVETLNFTAFPTSHKPGKMPCTRS